MIKQIYKHKTLEPMLSKKLEIALNKQINFEFASAYAYQFISTFFRDKGLTGFASWFQAQAKEEVAHAQKFIDYIQDRDGHVVFEDIKGVKSNLVTTVKGAVEYSLAHEKLVTGAITDILALAIEEKDYATENLLRWFIDEQVEEESTFRGILDAVVFLNDNPVGIYELDKKLRERA